MKNIGTNFGRPPSLYPEYEAEEKDRLDFTTWDISLEMLTAEAPDTATLLQFLGYLDRGELWFDLFHNMSSDAPGWFGNVARYRLVFNKNMKILQNYAFVDVNQSHSAYSIHQCVHD